MAAVKRSARIGERLREELALTIAREVRDPRVLDVTVVAVRMTDDLQLAKVLVRTPSGDDLAARKALLSGLASATGVLRREVARRLQLRYAPRLVFYYDEAPEKRQRIDVLLQEIAEAPRARDEDPEDDT